MTDKLVTIDLILDFMREKVEQKEAFPPSEWINIAFKINALLGNEDDKLTELDQEVAGLQQSYMIANDNNVSATKLMLRTTDEYKELQKLKAKIKRAEEFVRIAKKRAEMGRDEMSGY
jgi:hypothetical protein